MILRTASQSASMTAIVALLGSLTSGLVHADKGVIAQANNRCFVISTSSGFVLARGAISVPPGAVVMGEFSAFGTVDIFDQGGNNVTGGDVRAFDENGNLVDKSAYIEDFGLTESGMRTKWSFMCEDQPYSYRP